MRLIDADALMETIRAHEYPLKSHFNSTDRGMFTIGIQQAVDEQPTIPTASPWHRVEDELPEPNIQCLVRDDDNNCAVGYYRQDARAWDSPFFGLVERDDVYYEDGDLCRIGKVVAWMPIEPPKEDA